MTDGQSTSADGSVFAPSRSNVRQSRWPRLAQKELREILRDRRTIFTLVLMPLLLYPLLTVVMRQFLLTSTLSTDRLAYRVGVRDKAVGERLIELLSVAGPPNAEIAQKTGDRRELPAEDLEVFAVPDLEAALRSGAIDIGLRNDIESLPRPARGRDFVLELEAVFLQNVATNVAASEVLKARLRLAGENILRGRLRQLGVSQPVRPVRLRTLALDVDEKPRAKTLVTMIPLILILMTITGAVYPAIDLTAGERERNTLEILVAAPTPRLSLLLGKYAAVLTVAVLTASVNFLAMGVTLSATGMSKQLLGEAGLTLPLGLKIFGLMVLFAAFFAAMLLALCSFARSFKEAQAYLIPLMLVSLAPGVASLIPGMELSGIKVFVPLLNIVLLGRDLMEGRVDTTAAAMATLSTALYALAAIFLAARLFGSEDVLYSHQGGWREFVARPRDSKAAASVPAALLCLALLFPAYFVGSNIISSMKSQTAATTKGESPPPVEVDSLRRRILAAAVLQGLLFGGAPLLAVHWGRIAPRTGLQLRMPPMAAWPAAALIGVSMWPFAHELVVAIFRSGLATFDERHLQQVEATAKLLPQAVSYSTLLIVFALLPACSEELLFRGYVFSSLRARFGAPATVLGSALLFGLFHFVVTDALAIERLLPSTALGAAIGWICWQTGSIFPGMLAHFLHNGTLMTLLAFRKELAARGIGVAVQEHLPVKWLAIAGVALFAGFGLLSMTAMSKRQSQPILPTS